MKILFFMPHAGATRNFESTLRGLAEREHTIHLAFNRMFKENLPGLWDLANALTAEYPQITAGAHPQPTSSEPSFIAARLRASLDYLRFFNHEFRNAPKLRQRAERWAPQRVRRLAEGVFPPRSMMRAAFRSAERAMPISESVERYILEQDPDAVLVTPLLEPRSFQVEFVRAANRMGIATCLCVHSWDNLTNKGLIHELPDAVTVWNEMQRDEAVELHHVPPDRIVVTGGSPYDHWFGWKPSRSRVEFAASVGLDPELPFVAYLGSSGFIAPDEAGFIVEWMRALRAEGLGDIQVLARPHPSNPLTGDGNSQGELTRLENVKLYPPAGANPTDEQSRNDYFDSLYYCHAATGVNTTAFLEAAIIGRPVLTVRASSVEDSQDGMLHFHHLLNTGGGLLRAADTYEEHAADVNEALAASHPEGCVSERSVKFTEAFIRPHGLDQPATPELIETIEALTQRTSGKGPRVTLTGRILAAAAQRAATWAQRRQRRAKIRKKRHARERHGAPSPPEDPEARRDFYDRAAGLTPFLGARAGSGVYIVRTRDKHIGKSLFSKAGRGEMNVLARAVAVLESLYGPGVLLDKSLIDVGANIGTTTIPALLDHGFGRVVALEPEEDNFVTLRLNILLNQVEDRVVPLCKAASNRVGTAELIVNPERGGKHWIATDRGKKVLVRGPETAVRVDTVTLDQLAEDGAFDPDLTGLLWIDAEGHEGQIIDGARALTARGVPIVLEWNPRALDRSGGRGKIEEIANTAYSHFAPMRADHRGDEPRFWLRPTDQLGAYAERVVGPSRVERLTDILLLRLSPDQLPNYSQAEHPPSDLVDLSASVESYKKVGAAEEDASTQHVGRRRSAGAGFVDRLRNRRQG